MKKLIILLAAVAFASISQAATMSWAINNMQGVNAEAGWFVALYDGATTFNYDDAKSGTLTAWYTGTATASGTIVKAGVAGLNNPEGEAFSPGDTISMYAVIFKGSSIASATEYMVSDVVTGSVKANGANFAVSFGSLTYRSEPLVLVVSS